MPSASRVVLAALVAGLASGTVLLIGRLADGGSRGWPVAVGLFMVLFGAQLVGPGPHAREQQDALEADRRRLRAVSPVSAVEDRPTPGRRPARP